MNSKIENNLDEILGTLKDHMEDDEVMQCIESVEELVLEFFNIELTQDEAINLYCITMENIKNKL